MRSYQDKGIVIKKFNLGEADRILTIFTQKHGKKRFIAKGVRKLKSKKSGALDLFTYSKLGIVEAKGLPLVTEAEILQSFSKLRLNLNKIALAFVAAEIIDKLTVDEQENNEVLLHFLKFLARLSETPHLKIDRNQALSQFAQKLLDTLGFWSDEIKLAGSLSKYIESLSHSTLKSPSFLRDISEL